MSSENLQNGDVVYALVSIANDGSVPNYNGNKANVWPEADIPSLARPVRELLGQRRLPTKEIVSKSSLAAAVRAFIDPKWEAHFGFSFRQYPVGRRHLHHALLDR